MTADEVLLSVVTPVITRDRVAEYAEASGDLNPVHLDSAVARSAGHPDVIVHGMFVMALVADALSSVGGIAGLDSFSVRFVAVTPVDSSLTIDVTAGPERESHDPSVIDLGVVVRRGDGTTVVTGRARARTRHAGALAPAAHREGGQV